MNHLYSTFSLQGRRNRTDKSDHGLTSILQIHREETTYPATILKALQSTKGLAL